MESRIRKKETLIPFESPTVSGEEDEGGNFQDPRFSIQDSSF
jgi:hypothetical protein